MNFLTWFKSIKKLLRNNKKIKNINALNDPNASLAINYEDLLYKFKLHSEKHEELKLKIESINDTNDFFANKANYPLYNSNF